MANLLTKSLPPQSILIYSLFGNKNKLTAKEIGDTLQIFPHAVYRAIKPLEELGLIVKMDTYPLRFEAKPTAESSDLLSLAIKENFQELFATKLAYNNPPKLLNLSFIKDRNDLLEKTSKDIQNAKKNINFIVSGFEIPAESVLSFREASENGVIMRAIIQNPSEVTKGLLRTWNKLRVNVRYYPNMEARIFIIDNKIVYFTSYNQEEKDSGMGIRFNYPPYAKLMNELFEQRWKLSSQL